MIDLQNQYVTYVKVPEFSFFLQIFVLEYNLCFTIETFSFFLLMLVIAILNSYFVIFWAYF